MSLAMFAAPFDDNSDLNTNNSDNLINQKRRTHSKTYKKYPKENFDTNKVNSVLEKIHSNLDSDDDDDKFAFNPPPPSKSAGVERTKPLPQKEQMMNMGVNSSNDVMFRTLGRAPQPNYEGTDNLDLNDYKIYGDNKTNEEYYKRVIPGYTQQQNPVNKPYYSIANSSQPAVQEFASQDVLLQKLNYMITLLEDQQDERTNNVTEEVVLYSFLGIFIIFIADTFVKAGKYVR
jgi:hypothetical protein